MMQQIALGTAKTADATRTLRPVLNFERKSTSASLTHAFSKSQYLFHLFEEACTEADQKPLILF